MAQYIVDASIVIEYLVTGTYTAQVQAFFNQVKRNDELIVPEFCLLECANVIWKHVRFHNLERPAARILLKELKRLKLQRTPMKTLLDDALEIGLDHVLAVYDSGYIALAKHYGYPLLSLDQPQLRAAIGEGVTTIPISQFSLP